MHSKEIDPTISACSSSAGAETTIPEPQTSLPPTSHQTSYIAREETSVKWHPDGIRPLYFAYGSNLSFTQMRMRCIHDPDTSSKPLAIARLDGWRWLICQAGYANVIPPDEFTVGRQKVIDCDGDGGKVHTSKDEGDVVYGVLYEMTPADEYVLDGYEGVDHSAPETTTSVSEKNGGTGAVPINQKIRPREQGNGDYNKWYVAARVIEWLDEEQRVLRTREETRDNHGRRPDDDLQQVLVYVDEERVRVGRPKKEYIPRMNRAIREAETLGFPKQWAQDVMRKYIPEM